MNTFKIDGSTWNLPWELSWLSFWPLRGQNLTDIRCNYVSLISNFNIMFIME